MFHFSIKTTEKEGVTVYFLSRKMQNNLNSLTMTQDIRMETRFKRTWENCQTATGKTMLCKECLVFYFLNTCVLKCTIKMIFSYSNQLYLVEHFYMWKCGRCTFGYWGSTGLVVGCTVIKQGIGCKNESSSPWQNLLLQ